MQDFTYCSFLCKVANQKIVTESFKKYSILNKAELMDYALENFESDFIVYRITLPTQHEFVQKGIKDLVVEHIIYDVTQRAERKYDKHELDSARFLVMQVCTSGLDNPKKTDKDMDYSTACPVCKAGRIPKNPLHLPVNSMGKKMIDQNARYGFLIFDNELVEEIESNNLKGINFLPCRIGREDSKYREGRIINTFTKLSDKSIIERDNICRNCGKSGHYYKYEVNTDFGTKRSS